jgi:BirA family transcriptional regulator, biotin operon repressor / biotin---[acetyl-CoA-carboxylase] ligase
MALRLLRFERVGSTMDLIHELAGQGAAAGTTVIAGEQLAGRGARGRTWHSPPGGLWMSMLYRPAVAAGLEVISLRVGLAVASALDRFAGATVQLKWPNDLMLQSRKLGGILCEARWHGGQPGWIAVGVGLNVRNLIPVELQPLATALREHCPEVSLEDLIPPVAATLDGLDLQADRLTSSELHEFARRDWLLGRQIREPVVGTVAGLAADGTLVVRTAEGSQHSLRTGSVELVGVSSTW